MDLQNGILKLFYFIGCCWVLWNSFFKLVIHIEYYYSIKLFFLKQSKFPSQNLSKSFYARYNKYTYLNIFKQYQFVIQVKVSFFYYSNFHVFVSFLFIYTTLICWTRSDKRRVSLCLLNYFVMQLPSFFSFAFF